MALDRANFDTIDIRPHLQRLTLEYIMSRGSVVSPGLSRAGLRVVRPSAWAHWLGQTFVAGRAR